MAKELCPNAPFLFLSHGIGEERAVEALQSGATDCVLWHRLERLPFAIQRAITNSQERLARERAQQSLLFLAGAGGILGTSLEYETTLQNLAQLSVPFLADSCVIDIFDDDEIPQTAAIAHIVPEIGEMIQQFRRKYEMEEIYPAEMLNALKRGESIVTPIVPTKWIDQYKNDPEQFAFVARLHVHSAMSLPLQARGRTLGFVSLATLQSNFGSGRTYDEHDQALAENLAGRAALAVDNARLYRETQGAVQARDEFLATLSHELRTPLNAMLGWTQLLRAGDLDEAMTAQALEIVERNTKAQAQLIEDLLEVSRAITGKLRLDVQTVELNTVISDALESVRLAAEAKGVALEYSNRCDSTVAGDAHRLQQVVWNLLSNALKFTAQGDEVSVVLDQMETHARIVVHDSGQGIAPDFLPHVFERFRQADSSSTRSFGGLGLGLGIVRHLVELHGGTVQAESAGENQGATFTVLLPLLAEQSTAAEIASAVAQRRNVAPSLQSLREQKLRDVRVLVVDDQEDALDLIAAILEGCGARVQVASSARGALEKLQNETFDVLVSDIGMPEQDGYQLIRQVRALDNANRQISALALTAYARESDRDKALACGFQGHGVKPLEPAKLVELVAHLVENK